MYRWFGLVRHGEVSSAVAGLSGGAHADWGEACVVVEGQKCRCASTVWTGVSRVRVTTV